MTETRGRSTLALALASTLAVVGWVGLGATAAPAQNETMAAFKKDVQKYRKLFGPRLESLTYILDPRLKSRTKRAYDAKLLTKDALDADAFEKINAVLGAQAGEVRAFAVVQRFIDEFFEVFATDVSTRLSLKRVVEERRGRKESVAFLTVTARFWLIAADASRPGPKDRLACQVELRGFKMDVEPVSRTDEKLRRYSRPIYCEMVFQDTASGSVAMQDFDTGDALIHGALAKAFDKKLAMNFCLSHALKEVLRRPTRSRRPLKSISQ